MLPGQIVRDAIPDRLAVALEVGVAVMLRLFLEQPPRHGPASPAPALPPAGNVCAPGTPIWATGLPPAVCLPSGRVESIVAQRGNRWRRSPSFPLALHPASGGRRRLFPGERRGCSPPAFRRDQPGRAPARNRLPCDRPNTSVVSGLAG